MKTILKENMNAVFAIESLRAGIPTRLSTRELPDLRENIAGIIKRDLEKIISNEVPNGRLIWGQYGQGKTHLLTMAEHIALDMNFAVSRVSLSREVSCHNLFNFYKKVAPRIMTPDSTAYGIHRVLTKKRSSDLPETPIQNIERYSNPIPAEIFETLFYTEGEEQDRIYSDLMGVKIPMGEFKRIFKLSRPTTVPPKASSFKQSEMATSYFGLLADVIKFCGYKGWIILIDEVELVGRLGKVSRLKAYQNLNWLLNWQGEHEYPIYTITAAATRLQDDTWFGKKNNDRDVMPELALEKFGKVEAEKIALFFTKALSTDCLTVTPANDKEHANLLDKVALLHQKAYSWQADFDSMELIKKLGSQTVRTYIRAALETLDVQYLYKEDISLNTAELVEQELKEDQNYFAENDQHE